VRRTFPTGGWPATAISPTTASSPTVIADLRRVPSILNLLVVGASVARAQSADIATTYRAAADSLIRAATADSAAYRRLGRLVDTFGHRLSGSASLEAAIDWILDLMKSDGLENVRGEPVMVPRWVRGAESADW
jgi:carboxypeptidase Q